MRGRCNCVTIRLHNCGGEKAIHTQFDHHDGTKLDA